MYRAGDILFVHHRKGWLSALIRKVTKCEYNHVGLFVSSDEIVEATFRGVVKSPLSKFDDGVKNGILYYTVKRPRILNEKDLQVIIESALEQVGKGYDIPKLIGLAITFLLKLSRKTVVLADLRDAWACSELVSECFFRAGYNLFEDVDYENITPADIYRSKLVEEIKIDGANS